MSKRYQDLIKDIDLNKPYPLDEALDLVKKTSKVKFVPSLEVHIRLGINTEKGEQQVRGICVLPHGTGKSKKVAVFTKNIKEAKDAGADIVGEEELVKKIKEKGKIDFEIAIAHPEMMKSLAQIARILGPKGLMPTPKNETVTKDVKKAIKEIKKGKVVFKNDDSGNIHGVIGKVSFNKEKLKENFNVFIEAVKKAKPAKVKGDYLKKVTICSTMGPGIKVEL